MFNFVLFCPLSFCPYSCCLPFCTRLVPGAPPQDVTVVALSSRSIKVEWLPPPSEKHHGQIIYYRIVYRLAEHANASDTTTLEKVFPLDGSSQNLPYSTTISNLKKFAKYEVQVLAGTKIGNGPWSVPVTVTTEEDGNSDYIPLFTLSTTFLSLYLFCFLLLCSFPHYFMMLLHFLMLVFMTIFTSSRRA